MYVLCILATIHSLTTSVTKAFPNHKKSDIVFVFHKFIMLASTLILFLSLISLALSLPSPFNRLHLREEGPGSPFECEAKYDAASRKQYLQSVGAKPLDLAITILETYVFPLILPVSPFPFVITQLAASKTQQ